MSHAKIRFFGIAQGTDSKNAKISFMRRKSVALLSYLLVTSRQHSRTHLAALLWPDLKEQHARNNLRVALSRLSKNLGTEKQSLFVSDRKYVQTNSEIPLWLDIREFDLHIAETKKHEHEQRAHCTTCYHTLKKAVALYQGMFLDNLDLEECDEFNEWQSLMRERYRMDASAALADLSSYCERAGDYVDAENLTRENLLIEPLSEDANRRLMRLLFFKDKRNEALEHFNTYQKTVQNELGVELEDATVDLFHHIRAGSQANTSMVEAYPSEFPGHISNNLPLDMTTFVGRENDLTQLEDSLKKYKLITLLGIGGTGKTRLALEFARRQLQMSISQQLSLKPESAAFSDGVYFVSLDLVTRVEDIPVELAKTVAMDILPAVDVEAQIITYLKDKSMLLVFDNFEHLAQGNAVINNIIKAAPAIKVVITSRQKLAISAEAIFRVSGLDYLSKNDTFSGKHLNSAAKLFVDSAKRVALDFDPKKDGQDTILKVCQLVKGHPLAIILAASWIDSLNCDEIYQELSAGIGLLETKVQDVPERHQSIYAAFTSSWELLSESDQRSYVSLSIFRGGFDRNAASDIADISLMEISNLLNRSLIEYNSKTGRYEFHNLMHQFLQNKSESVLIIEQRNLLLNQHATYFFSKLKSWEERFHTHNAESILAFDRDCENVRMAWEWAIAQERTDLLEQGVNSLRIFCTVLSRYQMLMQLLEPSLRLVTSNSNDLAAKGFEIKLLVALGTAYISLGSLIAPEVKENFERATRLSESLETSSDLFSILNSLAAYYWCIVDFESCLKITAQWRERLSDNSNDAVDDQSQEYLADAAVAAHFIDGAVRYQRGEFKLAQKYLEQAILLYRPERHVEYIATYGQEPSVFCRYWLARCYWVLGKPEKAKQIAQEAVDIAQGFEHPFTKMFANCAVLDIAIFDKRYSEIDAAAQIVAKSAVENGFFIFQAIGAISKGLALCDPENNNAMREQGLTMMEHGFEVFNMQMVTKETYASHIAHVYMQEKRYDKALNLIDETLHFSELTGSDCSTADLLQLKANVIASKGLNDSAEELFIEAIKIAVRQNAKMLQLRAATSYAVYLQAQGRFSEARESVSRVYTSFDEAFETVDLRAASAVLKNLESELGQ